MAPEPLHSAPAAPPPDRGQDCHFGDKNSVCNNNVPSAVDNPPPQTPCRTRRLPQARPSTESSAALAGPLNLQPGHPGQPGSFRRLGRLRDSARLFSPERDDLRTVLLSWTCPCPSFLPLLLLGPHQTPESRVPGRGQRRSNPLLAGTWREIPSSGAGWGTPFSVATSRPRQSPGLFVPTS